MDHKSQLPSPRAEVTLLNLLMQPHPHSRPLQSHPPHLLWRILNNFPREAAAVLKVTAKRMDSCLRDVFPPLRMKTSFLISLQVLRGIPVFPLLAQM